MDTESSGFSFKWNKYSENVKVMLQSMLLSQDFADVTLVSDDQKQIQAHKIILSYCSSQFKTMIQNNPHPMPLIYMRGVKYDTLKSLVDFMYVGEAFLHQECVDDFIRTAKELQIKELCTNQEKVTDTSVKTVSENCLIKEESCTGSDEALVIQLEDVDPLPGDNLITLQNDISNEENKILKDVSCSEKDTELKCKDCHLSFSQKASLKRHIQGIHEGVKYPCDECELKFTQAYNAQIHMFKVHNRTISRKHNKTKSL